jgi:hypothetical protein
MFQLVSDLAEQILLLHTVACTLFSLSADNSYPHYARSLGSQLQSRYPPLSDLTYACPVKFCDAQTDRLIWYYQLAGRGR